MLNLSLANLKIGIRRDVVGDYAERSNFLYYGNITGNGGLSRTIKFFILWEHYGQRGDLRQWKFGSRGIVVRLL